MGAHSRYTILGLLLLLALGLPSAQAEEALRLGVDIEYGLLVDPGGQLTVDAVAALPDEAFEPRQRPLAEGYTSDVFWLRLTLPAELFAEGERWLEVFPPFLDLLSVYHRPQGSEQPWQSLTLGDKLPASQRPIDHRLFVFPLTHSDPQRPLELLIRLHTTSSVLLEATLWTPQGFASHALKLSTFWGFYFGMALLSTLFAAAVALVLRTRTMLAITLFGVAYLMVASVQGLLGWTLLRNLPWLTNHLTSLSVFLTHVVSIWIAREALQLYRYFPRLDRFVLAVMALMLLLSLSIPLQQFGPAVSVLMIVSDLVKAIIIVAGVVLWRRLGFTYGLITFAYGLLSLASILSVFTAMGLIPLIPGLFLLWQYMLLVMMLLITGISIYRVWLENQEKRSRERLENELRLEREASSRQRQFVGMVSHEFRTPLAVIAASATNLAAQLPAQPPEWRTRVTKIQRACKRLSQLTDNCLADARLASQIELGEVATIDLLSLLRDAAEIADLSGQHQIDLSVDGQPQSLNAPTVSCPIEADSALLRIALSNVIDNAVKYAPPGTIQVAVVRESSQWRVSIRNQGPMIPATLQAQLFDAYIRGTREHGLPASYGAGLGLFIARQIARNHGGELVLKASTSEETALEFTLPTQQVTMSQNQ